MEEVCGIGGSTKIKPTSMKCKAGFLWSPKCRKDGGRNRFYDNMVEVRAGDLILSFCDARIKALGIAQGSAQSVTKPEFGSVGDQWDDEGWLVPVDFEVAEGQVRPRDFIDELIPYLATKYAPLQQNGNGNQGVYLAEVSQEFTQVILEKMGSSALNRVMVDQVESANAIADEGALEAVKGRTDIGETQKQQLVMARRGQGVFKANVRLNERCCRLTGVTDPHYLIASHIKPWRDCNDQEKLDGCNGLLLSPHVDRLFDRGLISFSDDGTVLKSSELSNEILSAWGLDNIMQVGPFSQEQCIFLAIHRATYFRN